MNTLLSGLFSRKADEPRSRRQLRRGQSIGARQLEQLEQRLAMAINVYVPQGAGAQWAVIASDGGDDVYMQQAATSPQNLLIADNGSFNNAQSIANINALTTVYATNGTNTNVFGVPANTQGSGRTTSFVLDRTGVVTAAAGGTPANVSGSVTYAGNTWTFTNGGNGNVLTFSATPTSSGTISNVGLIRPTSGAIVQYNANGAADYITVNWSSPPSAAPASGISAPTMTASYSLVLGGLVYTDFGISASATPFGNNPSADFALPVTNVNPGGIVPGTLVGSVVIDGNPVLFRTTTLFTPLGNTTVPLAFGNATTFGNQTLGAVTINPGTGSSRVQNFSGYVNYETGVVHLDFFRGGAGGAAQNPGPVSISANYAVYNQDAQANTITLAPGQDFSRELFAQPLVPGSSIDIKSPILQNTNLAANGLGQNGVTLAATNINIDAPVRSVNYFDVAADHGVLFTADRNAIVASASAQAIVSPTGTISAIAVPAGGGGQGYDNDPANAPRVTFSGGGATTNASGHGVVQNGVVVSWVVDNPGAGYTSIPTAAVDAPPATDAAGNPWLPQLLPAVAERLNFNAAVAANSYYLAAGDDPGTVDTTRGRLFVSSTGSLSGALAASSAAVTTAATSLYAQADTADIVVEGTIFATSQTYLMRSPAAAQDLAPFAFTTQSPLTGANTGLIQGTTVAVTLGNSMPTPEQDSNAASVVNLRTQVGSMRVTAATPSGNPLAGPYPYELTINELDNLTVDAVAASGRAISLSAVGSITFNSALATAGDLSINAGGAFTVSAPLSTSRGQIQITGTSLNVANSVRVLDAVSDDTRDDISLTATAGDLTLTGAVTALNNVRLVQRNKAATVGKLGGQTRVIARGVVVEAEGAADLKTDVVTLEGRAGGDFSVDELNDITIPSLRATGFVTLVAGGTDPGVDNPATPNEIALTATLTDVTGFSASAPRGSVSVMNNVAKTMTLGDVAKIAAGTATSMQAAGSVSIRSAAGSVIAADAPIGGGSAIQTRVATTANLAATFAYNTPGTFASTLTGPKAQLVIDGVALKIGDRVLVKNQSAAKENGVYVVTTAGSSNTAWKLTRATDADTSAELPANSYVQVAEGTSSGQVFVLGYTVTDNVSPVAVTTVLNRADATRVRTATTAVLGGVYSAVATTITGNVNGLLPAIDGATLAVGDLLLVRLGASTGGAAANGVYEVTNAGSANTPWVLTRALDPNTALPITAGYVATTEGSFRASATGQAFLLGYDSLGNDPMVVTAATPTTDVGTDNVNSTTTFVVSSTAGTNAAAGSLGKMIGLRLATAPAAGSLNPDEVPGFTFATTLPGLGGAGAGVIRLTQELPAITKAFAINGSARTALTTVAGTSPRIVVDGSRIVTTRFGNPSANAAEVNGFSFEPGSGAAGGAAGGSVANMTVGGFAKGSAVKINGVNGILVQGMTLGRNEVSDRLANLNGVRITGNAAGATVLGGTIVGNTGAGVLVEAGSTDYAVVGTTVGAVNQNNGVGIDSAGSGRIGVKPLSGTTIDATTVFGNNTIDLPATVPASAIYLGQTISGAGIAAGSTIAAINGSTITLSAPMTADGATKLSLGTPGRTIIEQNLTGISLSAGATTVANASIQSNTYSGIDIRGGTQSIGTATTRDASSNEITTNGRWGVNVIAANSAAANTLLAAQKIQGNVFARLAPNKLGNIGVGTATSSIAAVGGYVASTTTNLDANGNEHRKTSTSAGSGSSGGITPPTSGSTTAKYPWRARR